MEAVKVTDEALLERIRTHKKVLPYITQEQSSNVYGNFHLDHKRHEKNQGKYEDKLLTHLGHTTMLSSEIEQQYGFRAPHVVLDNYVGNRSNIEKSQIIDDILRTRQQQYLDKLNTTSAEFRHLLMQREQLENETDKVEQIKRLITIDRAPITGSITDRAFSEQPPEDIIVPYTGRGSSQSVTSFIKLTNDRLPAEIEKYKRLRDNVEQRCLKLYKPYDGHLGPQSYKSWQLADYHMVRSIVDELVERFLDSYFWKSPSYHDTETAFSVLQAETQKWESQRKAIIQATAVQLIMEETVLQVTRKLTEETAEEFVALYKFIYNRSDTMFTKAAQSVAKGESYEDVNIYNRVVNMFHTLQHERSRDRLSIFLHSQQVDSKRRPQNENNQQ